MPTESLPTSTGIRILPRSFADYEPYLKAPEDGTEVASGVRSWRYV